MSEELTGKSRSGWGGSRANSGGARPNAGGARPNSGGPRLNAGGARVGAGRPRARPVLVTMPFDVFQWYCVRTNIREEKLADEAVRLAGFTVFNPSVWHPAIKPKRDINGVLRPGRPERVSQAFPRFFLVSLNLSDPSWRAVRNQPGVKEIMSVPDGRGGPGIPVPIPDREIDALRKLCAENDCIYPPGFTLKGGRVVEKIEAGMTIRLIDDPLGEEDVTFICDWSDGKRLGFLRSILGRQVPWTVKQSSVQIAA